MTTRRETLKVLAVAGTLQLQHGEHTQSPQAGPYTPQFFTDAEYTCITAVLDRIIPSDETPGAREAGVAQFVDESVKTASTKTQDLYREGVAKLVEAGFTKLSEDKQDAALRELDEYKDKFWLAIRSRAIEGFYTSKIGLKELGYTGKSFLSEFKGCHHPEHQA